MSFLWLILSSALKIKQPNILIGACLFIALDLAIFVPWLVDYFSKSAFEISLLRG